MYMWCFYFPGKPDDNVSNYIHGVLKVSLKKNVFSSNNNLLNFKLFYGD